MLNLLHLFMLWNICFNGAMIAFFLIFLLFFVCLFLYVLLLLLLLFLRQGFSVALEPVLELALVDQAGLKLTEIRLPLSTEC